MMYQTVGPLIQALEHPEGSEVFQDFRSYTQLSDCSDLVLAANDNEAFDAFVRIMTFIDVHAESTDLVKLEEQAFPSEALASKPHGALTFKTEKGLYRFNVVLVGKIDDPRSFVIIRCGKSTGNAFEQLLDVEVSVSLMDDLRADCLFLFSNGNRFVGVIRRAALCVSTEPGAEMYFGRAFIGDELIEHASPPCQKYTSSQVDRDSPNYFWAKAVQYFSPKLLGVTRKDLDHFFNNKGFPATKGMRFDFFVAYSVGNMAKKSHNNIAVDLIDDDGATGDKRPASIPGDLASPALTPADVPNIAHAKDGRFAINDDIAPSGEERKKIGVYIGKGDFELLEAFAKANGFQNPTKAARHLLLRCLHHEMK